MKSVDDDDELSATIVVDDTKQTVIRCFSERSGRMDLIQTLF